MNAFKVLLLVGLFALVGLNLFFGLDSRAQQMPPQDVIDYEWAFDNFADAGLGLNSPELDAELRERRVLVLTTDINAASSRLLIKQLLLLDRDNPGRTIDLYLRTEGGWEADLFSVVDVMQSLDSPVNVHAMGDVHSSGAAILAAATGERIVYPNTILGFHAAEEADGEIYIDRYVGLFERYANISNHWLNNRDGELYYFTVEEALRYGVADRIAGAEATETDPRE
ncbi:MAG: ATP-dependent Clp protease proteolytic subunit [Opitutales bacterium]